MNRNIYPQSQEIAYLKADINYTIFYLQNGRKFVSSTTLKQHQAQPQLVSFLRVNKSHLLNPDFIKSISKEGKKATVKLIDGSEVRVSRRKLSLVQHFNL
jgi:DNA-binding LytR/AlgR family response regulator